ncbi:M48 family metalloprotease [Catenuloplanes japonicus]|uniref:M48 family metalloprotease n=1 Tax=Catenuloplanes japonicus TaxID=33876 RepID=UPI0005256EB8|nr:M48 family metalloprotease [Catenuloplanes japonicus]
MTADWHPLSLPSPARGRYALLVLVLVLAGAFGGNSVAAQLEAGPWLQAYARCAPLLGKAADFPAFVDCMSMMERRRLLFMLSGAVLVLALGLILMALLPCLLARRAGPLRAASTDWQTRAAALAAEGGLRRAPRVVFGNWRLSEAFTVRLPTGLRIVLPHGAKRLPMAESDALLRHELAHIAAGDVTLVWLTRGVWWAVTPVLLAAPLIVYGRSFLTALGGPLPMTIGDAASSLIFMMLIPYWGTYLARVAFLLAVAGLLALSVLRSREHEADLRAVRFVGTDGLGALLRRAVPGRSTRLILTAWSRVRALHPGPERRIAVLHAPGSALGLRPVDALAAGLLAAMTLGALSHVFINSRLALLGVAANRLVETPAALLLAVAWGTAVWRAAFAAAADGRPLRFRAALFALGTGLVIGSAAQIWDVHLALSNTYNRPAMLLFVPLLVMGAGGVVIALARWCATRRAGRPLRRAERVLAGVVTAAVFVGGFWSGAGIGLLRTVGSLGTGPDPLYRAVVISALSRFTIANAAAALTCMALAVGLMVLRKPDRPAVRDAGRTALLCLASATTASALRWATHGPLDSLAIHQAERDAWAAVAAGLAVLVVLVACRGSAALGAVMIAAPPTIFVVAAACWLPHLGTWTRPVGSALLYLNQPSSAFALIVLLLGLPLALLPRWRLRLVDGAGGLILLPLAGAVVAAALIALMLAAGELLLVPVL